MATAAAVRAPITEAARTRRIHATTGWLVLLMTLGTYLDGWAHTHLIAGSVVVAALIGCGLALASAVPERSDVVA